MIELRFPPAIFSILRYVWLVLAVGMVVAEQCGGQSLANVCW
jgi:hypothetical protein